MKFLSGPCTAEWAIDCFLYSPPSFFLNTAINFLSCLTNSFSLPSLSPPQLSLLQKRMHKASAEYFKQRGRSSRAGLDRCQALSHESDRGIARAQVSIRVKNGRGEFSKCHLNGKSPPPIELLCRCRLPSKRRCIPFIPQRLRVPLGIV